MMTSFQDTVSFYARSGPEGGVRPPEIFALRHEAIVGSRDRPESGLQEMRIKGVDLERSKGGAGIEQVAGCLEIAYPSRDA